MHAINYLGDVVFDKTRTIIGFGIIIILFLTESDEQHYNNVIVCTLHIISHMYSIADLTGVLAIST